MLIGYVAVHAQQVQFSWTPAPYRQVNSKFTLWKIDGSSVAYMKSWDFDDTNAVLDVGLLGSGTHHFSVTQISTNTIGVASTTAFSGEVQVMVVPAISLIPAIYSSTNLGRAFTLYTQGQPIVVPSIGDQRYYIGGIIKYARTNQIVIPPPTP